MSVSDRLLHNLEAGITTIKGTPIQQLNHATTANIVPFDIRLQAIRPIVFGVSKSVSLAPAPLLSNRIKVRRTHGHHNVTWRRGVFCWLGARLKQVRIDNDNLYVAGFYKEITIPLTGISSVSDLHGGSPVIVRLKEKSDFGPTILFAAKWHPVLPWEHHPILTELNQLIKAKQNELGGYESI